VHRSRRSSDASAARSATAILDGKEAQKESAPPSCPRQRASVLQAGSTRKRALR
jgi:hypothetical protein